LRSHLSHSIKAIEFRHLQGQSLSPRCRRALGAERAPGTGGRERFRVGRLPGLILGGRRGSGARKPASGSPQRAFGEDNGELAFGFPRCLGPEQATLGDHGNFLRCWPSHARAVRGPPGSASEYKPARCRRRGAENDVVTPRAVGLPAARKHSRKKAVRKACLLFPKSQSQANGAIRLPHVRRRPCYCVGQHLGARCSR
jgi:hypothetical protein